MAERTNFPAEARHRRTSPSVRGCGLHDRVIAWRLFGRREAVADYVAAMREAKMPRRIYSTDDAGNYLSRVLDGYSYQSETVSEDAKAVARELDRIMTSARNQHGMMAEVRTWAAINEAVEKHSPEELSPPSVTGGIHHWINRATSGQLKPAGVF